MTIRYYISQKFSSRFGPIGGAERNGKIVALWFGAAESLPEDYFARQFPKDAVQENETPALTSLFGELEEYFRGIRKEFNVPCDPAGTPFQKKVWDQLREIPYGKTCSYGEVASGIDSPRAAMAVGQANAANPIAIIFPCHRVIGAGGDLVGYASGLERKENLLKLEGAL